MTAVMFMNVCSFLRIDSNQAENLLDTTRIHYEDYGIARKIAYDCMNYEEDEDNAVGNQAVKDLMEDSTKLN